MKLYSFILFTSALFYMQLFSSCKSQDCTRPIQYVKIDSTFLYCTMSYKDFDTIKFLYNSTDTVLFIGGKKILGSNSYTIGYECPYRYTAQNISQIFNYQTMYIEFKYFTEEQVGQYEFIINISNYIDFGYYFASDMCWTGNRTDTMYVLGKAYISPSKMINEPYEPYGNKNDTVYYRNGIIRIKYEGNVYEKIP